MDLKSRTVLVLGGAGLVGSAVARRMLEYQPGKLIIGALSEDDARAGCDEMAEQARAAGVELVPAWGDVFVPHDLKDQGRRDILAEPSALAHMVDDIFCELTQDVVARSTLGRLLIEARPSLVVDCINTAGALAYQNTFASAKELRNRAEAGGSVTAQEVDQHLSTLYLPQLIRHVQLLLSGMRSAQTEVYVKIGTAGTGGMGLNIPFTHSEERPSRVLLAKSGLAGAQTLLLYLMARTPDAPAVKEIKPTAAISWKGIGYGTVKRGGRPIRRVDLTEPLSIEEAFSDGAADRCVELEDNLDGVYLDAGENGLFSVSEFETLTALGLMEFVTPEEIAETVIREIRAHPTGKDVVAALDSATLGPTYRAGVLRSTALETMDRMEEEHGVNAVAYEMLGPPRLSKLLFEGAILKRLYGTMAAALELEPGRTAELAEELVTTDTDLRQRMLSIGIPVLLRDGRRVLRGFQLKAPALSPNVLDERNLDRGWVDLRAVNWDRWKGRIRKITEEIGAQPGPELGSQSDHQYGDRTGFIRAGRLAAWVFRTEDNGERIKR